MNMFSTGLFFGLGDCLAQQLFPHHVDNDPEKPTEYHLDRTVRASVYGMFIFGPLSVKWHRLTLPFIRNPFISAARRARMTPKQEGTRDNLFRLFIDAVIMPGILWIPLYNTSMSVLALHDNPFEIAYDKLRNNWFNVLKASWAVWGPLQLVNLFFVPVHLRIILSNIWSVGWNCFLSFVHNTSGHGKGSGKRFEELVDIETDDQEETMVYV